LVVGSGGTICREAALMGIPTINFHFWDAVAKYLYRKGFPIKHFASTEKIIKTAECFFEKAKNCRADTRRIFKELESPVPVIIRYIESFLK
jgi:predicted glycosyltransferase